MVIGYADNGGLTAASVTTAISV